MPQLNKQRHMLRGSPSTHSQFKWPITGARPRLKVALEQQRNAKSNPIRANREANWMGCDPIWNRTKRKHTKLAPESSWKVTNKKAGELTSILRLRPQNVFHSWFSDFVVGGFLCSKRAETSWCNTFIHSHFPTKLPNWPNTTDLV